MISARLAEYAIAAILAGLCCWGAYSWAHGRGYSAAEAHYEPILAQVRAQADEAEKRARAAEAAQRALDQQLEAQNAEFEKALSDRAAAAERRIAERLRLAQANRDRCRVSEAPATAGLPDGAAARAERDRRDRESLARRARDLGERFERDAHRLGDWQRRSIAASQPAP